MFIGQASIFISSSIKNVSQPGLFFTWLGIRAAKKLWEVGTPPIRFYPFHAAVIRNAKGNLEKVSEKGLL